MDTEALKVVSLIVGYLVILGGVPVWLTRNKGRGLLSPFLMGLFLGPIGWYLAWKAKPAPSPQEAQRLREEQLRTRAARTGKEWAE